MGKVVKKSSNIVEYTTDRPGPMDQTGGDDHAQDGHGQEDTTHDVDNCNSDNSLVK